MMIGKAQSASGQRFFVPVGTEFCILFKLTVKMRFIRISAQLGNLGLDRYLELKGAVKGE